MKPTPLLQSCAVLAGSIALLLPLCAAEPPVTQLETVTVTGRSDSLIGTATTSSEGVVGTEQLARRPLLRVGEIVETIPGVIVSQHSGGAGRRTSIILRGFNLDHGTDLATSLDGMPINMPTHAHGQGYTDLNLLIPELVQDVRVPRRGITSGHWRFWLGGRVQYSLLRYAAQSIRRARPAARWAMRAVCSPTRRKSARGICSTPWNTSTTTARGIIPTTSPNTTACSKYSTGR